MLRLVMRDVRANAVRYLLSILAVTLGVAFVGGTFSLRSMLSDTFAAIVEDTAPADAYVQGADPLPGGSMEWGMEDARIPVPIALAEQLETQVEGVDLALLNATGSLVLVGADGTAVSAGGAPSLGIGIDERDPAYDLLDGRLPQSDGEIALESATLERSGLSVGEHTSIVLDGTLRKVEIAGEVSMGAPMAGATLVLLSMDTALDAYASDGTVPSIGVYAADGTDPETLVARIEAAGLDSGSVALEVTTGEQTRAETQESIDAQLGFVTTFLLIFALIALFVGAFIIANTFAMAVRRQVRQFALLRAIGTSPAQVFAVVVGQAAVIGAIGSLLGIGAGVGLVTLLRGAMRSFGMELGGSVPLRASTVVICILLGTIVSVIAALVPARQAALVAPVEAMRGEVSVPQRSLRRRAVIGGFLLAVGTTSVIMALTRAEHEQAEGFLAVGAVSVLLGALVVIAPLVRAAMWVLGAPVVAAVRPIGKLARGNLVRNPRRTGSTAGALMIGMALVGAAAVIAASAQASVRGIVESLTESDLAVVSATGDIPASALAEVAQLDEVDTTHTLPFALAAISQEPGAEPAADDIGSIASTTPEIFDHALRVEVRAGELSDLGEGTAVINETVTAGSWQVGDELIVVTPTGREQLTVTAVMRSNGIGASVLLSRDVMDALVPPESQFHDIILIDAAPGVSAEQLHEAVVETVAPYVVLSVQDRDEFADGIAAQVDQILVILYALLALSLVIAVLGIVNTQALSVLERTREIGLLRAVGLGRLQLAGTVTIESVLTAIFGALMGLAVGAALAATLPQVYAEVGLGELVMPWGSLAVMAVAALLAGALAALWPAVRAVRMRTLEAIATE